VTAAPRLVVIINPISGTGRRPRVAQERAALAAGLLETYGVEGTVRLTEGPGHAADLAREARTRGAAVVVAWGGDGTVNEVGSVLAFGETSLAIVPAGSGNGLARELGIPCNPTAAIGIALTGYERTIDAGEFDGRLFFNVAGVGLDARVARRFAAGGLARRGLLRYVAATARELFAFVPEEYIVVADGERASVRVFLVAVANAQQYGSGACIAPHARIDDGRLDVVCVGYRSPLAALLPLPRLFTGTLDRVPGVSMRAARFVELQAPGPVPYHVDGEPHAGGPVLMARARPAALRVRVRATTPVS
jgi:diacylglycerol kinase (ATP)